MPAVTSAGMILLGRSCGNMEQRRTVLLADTSTEFRILLREAMERTGEFLVEIAQTGDEVLDKVQEQEPDILIMDVILPGLDGLSALRELQELGYAPMTILTSAFVSDQTLTEATELGAAYFLPKPLSDGNTVGPDAEPVPGKAESHPPLSESPRHPHAS